MMEPELGRSRASRFQCGTDFDVVEAWGLKISKGNVNWSVSRIVIVAQWDTIAKIGLGTAIRSDRCEADIDFG